MIRGYKPNGYSLNFSREGKRIEAETRQCVHCQYTWGYGDEHDEPISMLGHATRRGYCLKCGGWVCCRDVCIQKQLRLVDFYLETTGKIRSCIPYEEWVNRIREKTEKLFPLNPDLTMTQNGIIIPHSIGG
jgi:hypothetical protein